MLIILLTHFIFIPLDSSWLISSGWPLMEERSPRPAVLATLQTQVRRNTKLLSHLILVISRIHCKRQFLMQDKSIALKISPRIPYNTGLKNEHLQELLNDPQLLYCTGWTTHSLLLLSSQKIAPRTNMNAEWIWNGRSKQQVSSTHHPTFGRSPRFSKSDSVRIRLEAPSTCAYRLGLTVCWQDPPKFWSILVLSQLDTYW